MEEKRTLLGDEGKKRKIYAKRLMLLVVLMILSVSALAFVACSAAAILLYEENNSNEIVSSYWMASGTLAFLQVPILLTVAVKIMADLLILRSVHMHNTKPGGTDFILTAAAGGNDYSEELEVVADGGSGGGEDDESDQEGVKLKLYPVGVYHLDTREFNQMSWAAGVSAYLSFTLMMMAGVLFTWMVYGTYLFHGRVVTNPWVYLISEVVLCLCCPLLLFLGGSFFAVVITYITAYEIDARLIISQIVPSIVLMEGRVKDEKSSDRLRYWVIAGHFYMMTKKPLGSRKDIRYALDTSSSTWLIMSIVFMVTMLTTTYFVNQAFLNIMPISIHKLIEDISVCDHYNCFSGTLFSYNYIACETANVHALANSSSTLYAHCFRFVRFGTDGNLATLIGITSGLLLFMTHFLRSIISVVNLLMLVLKTRLWGVLISTAGIGVIVLTSLSLFYGQLNSARYHIVHIAQVMMLGAFLMLLGFVLLSGQLRVLSKPIPSPKNKPKSVQLSHEFKSEPLPN